jgi:hypothetical protein
MEIRSVEPFINSVTECCVTELDRHFIIFTKNSQLGFRFRAGGVSSRQRGDWLKLELFAEQLKSKQ